MLKFQVRTLGRERRRQSTPLRDVFTSSSNSSSDTNSNSGHSTTPSSPWHDLSRARGRSTSVSSLSSASTSSECGHGQDHATIRVYTAAVRPDTDYKTLFANANTTAAELIRMVLNKFRIHFKDPDLFYLMMELTTKHEATDIRHAVPLDAGAKPLVLQACYPADRCRFLLHIRQTFQVRIYDSSVCATSNYKTLIVSQQTTCAEVVRMVTKSWKEPHTSSIPYLDGEDDGRVHQARRTGSINYGLALVDLRSREETMLQAEECLFNILYETPGNGQYQIHLRPLRPPRRFDSSRDQRMAGFENESASSTYYRRCNTTPDNVPFYSDDFALSGLASRLRDQLL